MTTLKTRWAKFSRMLAATLAPCSEPSTGSGLDALLLVTGCLLVVALLAVPTFIAVVIFGY